MSRWVMDWLTKVSGYLYVSLWNLKMVYVMDSKWLEAWVCPLGVNCLVLMGCCLCGYCGLMDYLLGIVL